MVNLDHSATRRIVHVLATKHKELLRRIEQLPQQAAAFAKEHGPVFGHSAQLEGPVKCPAPSAPPLGVPYQASDPPIVRPSRSP